MSQPSRAPSSGIEAASRLYSSAFKQTELQHRPVQGMFKHCKPPFIFCISQLSLSHNLHHIRNSQCPSYSKMLAAAVTVETVVQLITSVMTTRMISQSILSLFLDPAAAASSRYAPQVPTAITAAVVITRQFSTPSLSQGEDSWTQVHPSWAQSSDLVLQIMISALVAQTKPETESTMSVQQPRDTLDQCLVADVNASEASPRTPMEDAVRLVGANVVEFERTHAY